VLPPNRAPFPQVVASAKLAKAGVKLRVDWCSRHLMADGIGRQLPNKKLQLTIALPRCARAVACS
jgi:hypothetical protein